MTALAAHRDYLAEVLDRQATRRQLVDQDHLFAPQPKIKGCRPAQKTSTDADINADAGPSKRHVVNYVEEEETVRNDLTERYVQSGEFGSNYMLGAGDTEICEEYPALRKLMDLKSAHVEHNSHPPILLPLPSLAPAAISSSISPIRFDVILLRPTGTWAETAALPIRNISSDPGFIFLWVGKGDDEGLEKGRECFVKWGFRRAEDIVWVKTNQAQASSRQEGGVETSKDDDRQAGTGGEGLFASSKEHCLMGIRGTVRRSTDTRFVHCNVDTDILVWEQDEEDPDQAFPPYLYTLIENFCLGTRRLELFGNAKNPRRGWVTANIPASDRQVDPSILKFDPATYPSLLPQSEIRPVLPFHPEIDQLRPKSPPRRGAGGGGHHSTLPNRPPPPRYQVQHQQSALQAQMEMQAQAQAQMQMEMQMQMQLQHAQMMAAMNMGMGMDPMMLAQMQAMAMSQGQGQVQGHGQGQGMGMEFQNPDGPGMGMYGGMQQYDHQGQGQAQGQWDAEPGQGQGGGYPHFQHQQYQQFPGPGWGWQQ